MDKNIKILNSVTNDFKHPILILGYDKITKRAFINLNGDFVFSKKGNIDGFLYKTPFMNDTFWRYVERAFDYYNIAPNVVFDLRKQLLDLIIEDKQEPIEHLTIKDYNFYARYIEFLFENDPIDATKVFVSNITPNEIKDHILEVTYDTITEKFNMYKDSISQEYIIERRTYDNDIQIKTKNYSLYDIEEINEKGADITNDRISEQIRECLRFTYYIYNKQQQIAGYPDLFQKAFPMATVKFRHTDIEITDDLYSLIIYKATDNSFKGHIFDALDELLEWDTYGNSVSLKTYLKNHGKEQNKTYKRQKAGDLFITTDNYKQVQYSLNSEIDNTFFNFYNDTVFAQVCKYIKQYLKQG